MASQEEVNTFIALLKYFGIFQPYDKYKIVCPFHDDKNASLQINVSSAFFYCYAGCGAQGSSIELYKSFYKLKHPHNPAISSLKASIAISKIVGGTGTHEKQTCLRTALNAKEGYRQTIAQARAYFETLPVPCWYKPSNVSAIAEEAFVCREYMRKRGFSPKVLTDFQAKPSLNSSYPIIFPLLENGIFRGYVMRTFDKEIEAQRKYLYCKGFRRKDFLVGSYKSADYVVCVEGYLDLVKANQIGVKNVVAFLGWKASEKHLQKLQRAGVKLVVCALDSDTAGNKGYRYLQNVSGQYGFAVKRLRYPKGIKDFGDIKQGSKEAESILRQISLLVK